MSSEGESKGSFTGVFTLKSQADAVKLAGCVKNIVEGAVNIFYILEKEPSSAKQLENDIEEASRLIHTFPDICSTDELKNKALQVIKKIMDAETPILAILRENAGKKLKKDDAEKLAENMKTTLMCFAAITDLMEEEQHTRLLRFINSSFQHVLILKQTRATFRLEHKLKDAIQAWKILKDQMHKRADVTEKKNVADIIRNSTNQIVASAAAVVKTTQQVAANPTQPNVSAQEQALIPMVAAYQQLIAIVKKEGKVSSSSDFAYEGINEELEALRAAVKSGSTGAAVESAKTIAGEISNLEKDIGNEDDEAAKKALEEALAGLKDCTKKLVGATKDALQDPNKNDKLDNVIDDMAQQVLACSRVKRRRRGGLKDKLVKAADKLSQGIDDFATF